jgi:hypothetical protein
MSDDGWGLYSGMDGYEEADRTLTEAIERAKVEITKGVSYMEAYQNEVVPTMKMLRSFGAEDTAVREAVLYHLEMADNRQDPLSGGDWMSRMLRTIARACIDSGVTQEDFMYTAVGCYLFELGRPGRRKQPSLELLTESGS